MDRQLHQMVRLVDDLLDISRITRGTMELQREATELAPVIYDAVETSRPAIEDAGHELTVTVPSGPIPLEADPTRLAQVFANLLNNAAKYTPRGGRISLSAGTERSTAVVRVRDTGIGIPAHMLTRIFDMFTQVDRSLEKTHGGLGIGLTLVRRLVEMHGGTVEARSDGPGRGSEFVVTLPTRVGEEPAEALLASADGQQARLTRGRRILVVDDNRDAADCLAEVLKLRGHEAHTAHDGVVALEMAEALRPDAVLLDLGMPRLSGYDAAARLRERLGPQVLLVAVTGWGNEEHRRRSQEAGFDHHLVKPIDLAALQVLLERPPRP